MPLPTVSFGSPRCAPNRDAFDIGEAVTLHVRVEGSVPADGLTASVESDAFTRSASVAMAQGGATEVPVEVEIGESAWQQTLAFLAASLGN